MSSDIVEFFDSIDLDAALSDARPLISSVFCPLCTPYVLDVLHIILDTKYFKVQVSGGMYICKKRRSLSIGEFIATGLATLHRHARCQRIFSNPSIDALVLRHYAYIDDTLSILVCRDNEVSLVVEQFNSSIMPMRWEHTISTTDCHFLDVSITVENNTFEPAFHFKLFRKPHFAPSYLSWFSDHKSNCKLGILKAEATRIGHISDCSQHYDADIHVVRNYLLQAGYPSRALEAPRHS